MAQTLDASPDNIDITTVWSALRRAIPKLLVLGLLAGAVTYGALSLMSPQFESVAEIALNAKGSANPFASPTRNGAGGEILTRQIDKEAVNTHVQALQSRDLIGKVAAKLRLNRRREFNPALGPEDSMAALLERIGLGGYNPNESERDRVISRFIQRLVVFSPTDSRIVKIQFRSSDRDLAAKVANTLADMYRKRLANVTVVETSNVQKALEPKIEKLATETSRADAAVVEFRAKAGLHSGGAQKTPLRQQQLGDLTTELTRVSAARSAAEARAKGARELMQKGSAEVIPEVQSSPLIQNLIQQRVRVERDLLKFSASMKSAHPVIRQLNADLGAVKRQIRAEVAKVVASLDKAAFIAVEQESSVLRSLDAVKASVADKTGDQVKLQTLEAVAKSKRDELNRLRAQFEANRARAESGVVPIEAEIVSPAVPSSVPVFPRKGPYTALAMVATLFFGFAWSLTGALLSAARGEKIVRRSVVRPEATVQLPMAPVAERVEIAPIEDISDADGDGVERYCSVAPVCQRILSLAGDVETGFRTLVCGQLDQDVLGDAGLSLADELTESAQRTIVIDWSLDGAGVASKVGLASGLGFSELLQGKARFADVVRGIPGSAVHLIPCGSAFDEGTDSLEPSQLNLLLDALDEAYDQVIVVARHEAARILFEAIEGRFDAGITVGEGIPNGTINEEHSATFLGFEVTDIVLMKLVGAASAESLPPMERNVA